MIQRSMTLTVSVDRPYEEVYAFIGHPRNLPRWARAFCRSVSNVGGRWMVETPDGEVEVRFVEANDYGVADHWVTVGEGVEVYAPMRVVRNGTGAEVVFTLFQAEGMSDEEFERDAGMVRSDLAGLKGALEG